MPSSNRSDSEQRAQKRMRRGTKSCLNCRKRKIRCSEAGIDGEPCLQCKARGDPCIAQGELAEDDAVANRRLKARIAQLESRLQGPASEDNGDGRPSPDHQSGNASQALESLLAGINQVAQDRPSRQHVADHGEEEVETTSAPLVRLLNDTGDESTPSSTKDHDDTALSRNRKAMQRNSPKYIDAVRDLCSYLPREAEMEDIFNNHSSWWSVYQGNLDLIWGNRRHDTLRAFATDCFRDGHPTLLGLLLVCFAIATGDLSRYLPPIERRILNDDEYASTEHGLSCLFALGVCYIGWLQPRRAWSVLRRGITLLQLNGLHVRRKTEKHELLFWPLYHADRWASLMIGQPYMIHDRFCDLTIPPIEILGVGTWFYRQLAILSGKVIDCLQDSKGSSLSAALEVEDSAEDLRAQLPPLYLDLDDIRRCTDSTEKQTRLFRAVHFHQLTSYVHLPFLIRSEKTDRYEYSRKKCIDACRGEIEAYLEIFDTDPLVAIYGTVLNFHALTASVVLLMGVAGYGRSTGAVWPQQSQLDRDWSLLYRVLDALKHGSSSKGAGLLCQKCYTALEQLIATSRAPKGQPAKPIVVPYFGTLLISGNCETPYLPRPDVIQGISGTPATGSATQTTSSHVPHWSSRYSAASMPSSTAMPMHGNFVSDMSFAYDGPFLPEGNLTDWMSGAGMSWFEDLNMGGDWSWLNSDLPPSVGL